MGYYESVLRDLPFTALRLNTAENAYIDYTGRGSVLTGTPAYSPSILAGSPKSLLLTGGATLNFTTPVFAETHGDRPFTLEAWAAPMTSANTIGILTHSTTYDGLVFDGNNIKFVVKSHLNNAIEASWPTPDFPESYHTVGVYTTEKIQLYINGDMVSETDVPEEFRVGGFLDVASTNLYIGSSPVTTEKIVVDGPNVYATALSAQAIRRHFLAGRETVSMYEAVQTRGGALWDATQRQTPLTKTYSDGSWTDSATFVDVSFVSGDIVPEIDQTTLASLPGMWKTAIPLEATEDTSLGGVRIDWDGDGQFVVATSLDDITYTPVVNGRLVAGSNGLNATTNKTMFIGVSFDGGIVDDISELRRLTYSVYSDGLVSGNDLSRTMTLSGNVSTVKESNEPIERNVKAGFDFYGGEALISADATETPRNIQAVEMWVKMRSVSSGTEANLIRLGAGATNYVKVPVASGNILHAGASAVYVNGLSVATNTTNIKYGEWNHILYVASAASNPTITIGDAEFDGQVGMIALHPTAPTAGQALDLYRSYVKMPSAVFTDAATIAIVEPVNAYNLYNFAWDITSGG